MNQQNPYGFDVFIQKLMYLVFFFKKQHISLFHVRGRSIISKLLNSVNLFHLATFFCDSFKLTVKQKKKKNAISNPIFPKKSLKFRTYEIKTINLFEWNMIGI